MKDKYEQAKLKYLSVDISLVNIAKEFNLSRKHFSKYLKDNNVNIVNKHNLLKFDNRIFDNIDSEEKAYWLGFLYADGYVSDGKSTNNIEISLKKSDEGHLNKFRLFLKAENVVKVDSFRCRLTLSNKYLRERLIELGCVPRKSLVLKFPDIKLFSDIVLIKHFIRGYFDGDGCISLIKGINPQLSILGTTEFLNSLQNQLDLKTRKLSRNNYKSKSDTMVLSFYGRSAISFADFLYNDSTIYLDRKYDKYRSILFCRPSWKQFGLLSSKNGEG